MGRPNFLHVERVDVPRAEQTHDAGEHHPCEIPMKPRPKAVRREPRLRPAALSTVIMTTLALHSAPTAPAADLAPPHPTPTPALVLSTKPMPGCCCYPHLQKPGEWGCAWGVQEKKCIRVGTLMGKPYRWTPGRCPEPE